MTHFLIYKIITAIIVFAVALCGGFSPKLSYKHPSLNHVLLYGEYLARGIFLGVGLIHLLPEAIKSFATVYPALNYPFIELMCAVTILILYLIEKGLTEFFSAKTQAKEIVWLPYLIIVMLSVHSLIEGAVLGCETTLTNYSILAFAIIAHKAADGFALGVSLPKNHFSNSLFVKLIILFALLTPIGMFFGVGISQLLDASPGHLAAALFNAIAAGTFIYIALNEVCLHREGEEDTSLLYELIYFAAGVGLMAVVAIWL